MYKVLVVEDEKIIRQGINVLIRDLTNGFLVAGEASDGKRALEILHHSTPDVLITDIRMPEMDGISLIDKARTLYPNLYIIIISGYDDFEYAKKAILNGVHNYLLKPINRAEFMKTMESVEQELNQNSFDQLGNVHQSDHPIISKISMYIVKNLDQEVSLETIAEIVNLHPSYFSQWFKEETGINFSEFVTTIRMNKAKQLLRDTELKVYEIAQLSGYQSEKHFMKIFKKNTKKTPSEYRRSPLSN